MHAEQQRDTARQIFLQSLQTTTVAAAVERSVHCERNILRVADRSYNLGRYSEVCIISIGKAGATMFDAIDRVLPESFPRSAVVSAPAPPRRSRAEVLYFRGGHPGPNRASMDAARAALRAIDACPNDGLVLFLISGGASAIFELPISEDITLEDLSRVNQLLIGSGASIAEINCVRKHLSRVKGGRLAVHAASREKITLLISDVPDNALDSLGSGPSLPDSSTVEQCLTVISRFGLTDRLPTSVQQCIAQGLTESPKPGHPAFDNALATVLLGNATFLAEAERIAVAMGYKVTIDCSCDDWDYEAAANYLLARLGSLRKPGKKICLLSGGEVTVRLPENPGIGGRNLQFCLYCAGLPLDSQTTVLSAGTDGIDGNSLAAGAVADATTRERGERIGLQLESVLRNFDAFNYFRPLGDAVLTGPSGNNLRDIRMLLWEDAG